ncbi:ACP S-malonyltransferase [Micromonospora sp. HUAS YX12]|uniref:[acyl-carrier-protein] S-malonyltransferase n=1 Tax=Micromonospora sp. HUAS YX12 TaxID=3156396 RepID=A0AAU7QY06_9ACTN
MTEAVLLPGLAPSNHRAVGEFMVTDPYARRRVAQADAVLGRSLVDGFRTAGPAGNADSQLAFMVNCIALADRADQAGMSARLAIGPSFGQFALAAHLGVLPFEIAVELVIAFSDCEREYFRTRHTGLVTRFFYRLDTTGLAVVRRELTVRGAWNELSCDLDAGFAALTLARDAVPALDAAVRAIGGIPLYSLSPPVHSSAFGQLRDRCAEVCHGVDFAAPRMPVVSDHDGTLVTTGPGVRELLLAGIVRPVRWPAAMAALTGAGVRIVWVPGPSNLFDRLARTAFEVRAVNPENAATTCEAIDFR